MLDFFKYIAIAVTMISGILALFIEIRDPQGKIKRKGYWLFGAIVASAAVAFVVQTLELQKAKADNQAQAEKTLAQSRLTNRLLRDIDRNLNPVREVYVTLEIAHPVDSLLQAYGTRVARQIRASGARNWTPDYISTDLNYGGYGHCFQFPARSRLMPDHRRELLVEQVLTHETASIDLIKHFDKKAYIRQRAESHSTNAEIEPDLSCDIDLDLHHDTLGIVPAFLTYSPDQRKFLLTRLRRRADRDYYFRQSSVIKSTLDLPGCALLISLSNNGKVTTRGIYRRRDYRLAEQVRRSSLAYTVGLLTITIDRKIFRIPAGQMERLPDNYDGPVYLYTFPEKGNYSDDEVLPLK